MNSEWYKWDLHKIQQVDEKMGIPIFWDAECCKYMVQGIRFKSREAVLKHILDRK